MSEEGKKISGRTISVHDRPEARGVTPEKVSTKGSSLGTITLAEKKQMEERFVSKGGATLEVFREKSKGIIISKKGQKGLNLLVTEYWKRPNDTNAQRMKRVNEILRRLSVQNPRYVDFKPKKWDALKKHLEHLRPGGKDEAPWRLVVGDKLRKQTGDKDEIYFEIVRFALEYLTVILPTRKSRRNPQYS
jgi:hypothetical protein